MTKRLFRLRSGDSVYACKCGCEFAVRVTPLQEQENVGRGYYVSSHAPLGCASECKGPRYPFTADAPGNALEASAPQPATRATPVIDKINSRAPKPLSDDVNEWDADESTPLTRFSLWDEEEPT